MTDTRKELIRLLRSNMIVLQAAGTSATATLRLADHLIDNGVTVQKWIPVSERLPVKFGEYIVTVKAPCGTSYSDYADYDPFSERWTTGLFFDIGSKVTHWMPLPKPPKDGEAR